MIPTHLIISYGRKPECKLKSRFRESNYKAAGKLDEL